MFERKCIVCGGGYDSMGKHNCGGSDTIVLTMDKATDGYSGDYGMKQSTSIAKSSEGVKFDSGKPKLSLLTPESLAYEAAAFEYGMKKYAKGNYKLGMDWSRVADAGLRHLTAWANKQDTDAESGLNHLAHAKACIAMLIYYVENNKGTDDR